MVDPSRDQSPDPTSDEWSAWLPHLDPPDAAAPATPVTPPTATPPSATTPLPPAPSPSTPPLPQRSAPRPPAPLPPPHRPPRAAFGLTVSHQTGRSHSTGWRSGAQPGPGRPAMPVAPGQPATHLGLALLALLFFPVPFGLVALVRALQVSPYWAGGRYERARVASQSARRWSVAAFAAFACLTALAVGLSALTVSLIR